MKRFLPLLTVTLAIVAVSIHAAEKPSEPNANKIVEEWSCHDGSEGGIGTIGIADGPIVRVHS